MGAGEGGGGRSASTRLQVQESHWVQPSAAAAPASRTHAYTSTAAWVRARLTLCVMTCWWACLLDSLFNSLPGRLVSFCIWHFYVELRDWSGLRNSKDLSCKRTTVFVAIFNPL